jgi:hypothetical protein
MTPPDGAPFNTTTRPDVHERFLAICAREAEHHAAHLAWVKGLALPRRGWRGRGVVRMPLALALSSEAWGELWSCPRCGSVYLVRGGEPRCRRCT